VNERLRNPVVWRSFVALTSALALVGSYFGATWLLERTPPQPAAAAEPAATSRPASTRAPADGPIVVHGTGDVLLDPRQLGLLASGFEAPWTGVRELFTSDDLTIVNLECAPSTLGEPEDKEFTFRCPRGFEAMRRSGVEVTNLGNNHSGDFGREAMMDGRRRLLAAGLAPVGSGPTAREANEPALFELRGRTVAVLGFGGVVPAPSWIATSARSGVADGYDTASMVRAVRAASERADIVFVTVHWGAAPDTTPRADDVARGHALIDAGADAVFGHHAHRLQPLELYEGRPIFWGLGNFVWPAGGPTAVARVVIPERGPIQACLMPGRISGGRPVLDGPPSC
jgi:poly-gamma-glutamate synthesis protein (capsule biosynthesis protein)